MELPDLGRHCSARSCMKLDFLPLKCDSCGLIFCKDHYGYAQHNCEAASRKDVQVPVCPLCNNPVPIAKGELVDVKVSQHIDQDCRTSSGQKAKIFTNRCSFNNCKQKELIPVKCDQCKHNFCLKHRHFADHNCGGSNPRAAAAAAAASRASGAPKRSSGNAGGGNQSCSTQAHLANVNGAMGEDEALAYAMQISMGNSGSSKLTKDDLKRLQEEEDRRLAEALARDQNQGGATGSGTNRKKDGCTVS